MSIDTRTLQAYLGHRSINSTTRYAALAPGRFKNIWGRCNGSLQAALTWGRARLFLFSIRQHIVDACDDLPRVLDRSLALPDLVQEALTFFLRFFDQRRRRIEWYDLLLVHCPAPDQARLALLAREAALRGQTR